MSRKSSRQIISTKQLFTLLVIMISGRGLMLLPSVLVLDANQDAWISLLLSGAVALVTMNSILFMLKQFGGKGLISISEELFGKYLGKVPGLIYFFYFLVFSVLALRVAVDLFSTWLLPRTPIEILTIAILLVAYYAVRNGMKVMGRFCQMIAWTTLPIIPLIVTPFFVRNNLLFLLPVGGMGLEPILKASLPGFYAFLGFESLFLLYPYVREDATHNEVVKSANTAMLVVLLLKWFVVFSNIAVFGATELKFFLYPLLEYFKILTFPIIERVEFVLFYFWIFLIFCSNALLLKMSTVSLEQTLHIEGYKNTAIFLAVPIYYLVKIPQNIAEVQDYIKIIGPIGMLTIWLTLIIITVAALIRKVFAGGRK